MSRPSRSAVRVILTIVVLVLTSWGALAAAVTFGGRSGQLSTFGVGLALTAFVLGMRHAFDADHIGAIDNTTRRLIGEGQDPSAVGMWFALGHSTVVLTAVALVTVGVGAVASQIADAGSALTVVAGVWGPSVSSLFLLAIGGANLVVLVGMLRRARDSESAAPVPGGVVTRVLRRLGSSIDAPWKMFVVGLLFGLGFDTASTIALMVIAGGAGLVVPWYVSMVLPLLFMAGMVMCDGLNSLVMARMYRWTVGRPDRRLRYNVALITISVGVAFVVGLVGIAGVLVDSVGVNWPPVRVVAGIALDDVGFIVAGVLTAAWLVSFALARWGRTGRSG